MIRNIKKEDLDRFKEYLFREEKTAATIEKYIRDVGRFFAFLGEKEVTKELAVMYKQNLLAQGYSLRSINSMVASVNSFFMFMGWQDCKIKSLKKQNEIYTQEDKELTKAEYMKLLDTATNLGKEQLCLVMQTICGTGIRVSEVAYFTVEAAMEGEVSVRCKSKTRKILIPRKLGKKLLAYAAK